MGGNKHKNGIVCTFPGCAKTMRTQKFKLHFTKQHLKVGETYSVEHRRRYEVAREHEYAVDSTAASAAARPSTEHQHAATSVPIPASYPTVAVPSVVTALTALTPTDSIAAADSSALSSSSTDSSADEKRSVTPSDLLQRLNRMSASAQRVQAARSTGDSNSIAGDGAALAAAKSSAAAAAAATDLLEPNDALAPSRAVLVEYIALMDQRVLELVETMREVIDGQRELIDTLRRPIPTDAAQLLAQTPLLATQLQQRQMAMSASDAGNRKRRKIHGASEQQQLEEQQRHQRQQQQQASSDDAVASLL